MKKEIIRYCSVCGERLIKDGSDTHGYNTFTGEANNVQYYSCPTAIAEQKQFDKEYEQKLEDYRKPKKSRYEKELEEYNKLSWICKLFTYKPDSWSYIYFSECIGYPSKQYTGHDYKKII